MKILAIDTATERCSVAISVDGAITERSADTPRGHADMILPMIEALLAARQLSLAQLDGIAYGRGPGAFTGVRIAIGVAQGLAFGAQKPTVGISNLAAVAQQIAQPGERVLVCMDARMSEVYWGLFECEVSCGLVRAIAQEEVASAGQVLARVAALGPVTAIAGTGFQAYPELCLPFGNARQFPLVLPQARDIALLATREFSNGEGRPASDAQPVYLRNQVAFVKKS